MTGSRIFVALVFTLLAASFGAATGSLFNEFGSYWFSLAAVYSHTFLFFPTIGLVALIAFFIPATVFVDLYWHHVRLGKIRLLLGLLFLGFLSVFLAGRMTNQDFSALLGNHSSQPLTSRDYVPALWELNPQTLRRDAGAPAGCARPSDERPCERQPILRTLTILRRVAASRTGLTAFSRNCHPDPLLAPPAERNHFRYCFPILRKVRAPACCTAQQRFSQDLASMFRQEGGHHSRTFLIHAITLPFKTFFMLIILFIGFLLVRWRRLIDLHYWDQVPQIENGVLIGASAMMFWPVTNQAFLQSASVLYGSYSASSYQNMMGPVLSALFGVWALLLLLFFFRHHEKNTELWVKMIGAAISAFAAIKWNLIIDWAVRIAGAGAMEASFAILALLGLAVYISSFFWPYRHKRQPWPPSNH